MARANKKKSSKSASRKKKSRKQSSFFRNIVLLMILLIVLGGAGWFFRDAFGAFWKQAGEQVMETRQKLPKITIAPGDAGETPAPKPAAAPRPAAEKPRPAAPAAPPRPRPVVAAVNEHFVGRVVDVYTGDSVNVASGDTVFHLNLYGIDAPEVLQTYGTAARDALRDKLLDGEVNIDVVMTIDGTRCGRIVFDGRDINLEMVREGHAWHDRNNAPNEHALAGAEEAARRAGAGLWRAASPLPPWEFRSRQR